MRWIKIILIAVGGLVSVCLVLLAIALLILGDDVYRRVVIRAATHLTGYAITVDGPLTLKLSSEPLLSAQAIRFDPGPGGNRPPITAIGKLRVRIALWPLVTGTLVFRELQVEDAVMAVELKAGAAPDDPRALSWKPRPDIRIPVFESVRLHNIQLDLIDRGEDRRVEVRLRQFSIDDVRNSGALFVKGNGSISTNDFVIDGQLGALDAIFGGAQPYPVALTLRSAGFLVSATGSVADIIKGEGLALRLSGKAEELSNVFKLLDIETPVLGRLEFQAAVTRDVAAPRVSDLSMTLSNGDRLEIALTGAVDDAISGRGTDLRFTGSCDDLEVIRWMLPARLPEVHRIRVAGEVRETDGQLALENVTAQAGAAQGLAATVGGRMGLGESLRALSMTDMAIDIALTLPTADVLRPYGIVWPADMNPLSAHGRLIGKPDRLAVEDIFLEAGGGGPLQLTSRGRIGRLDTAPGTGRTISQVDLHVALQAEKTRSLASAFVADFPELGAISLNTRITGAWDRFQLMEIDGRTSSARGLQISLAGRIDVETDPESGLLGKLDVRTSISAPSVRVAIAPFAKADWPDMRPFRADARVGGTFEDLSLDNLTLSAGQSGPLRINISGEIGRLSLADRSASGGRLETTMAGESTAALSAMVGDVVPNFGPFKATAHIADRNGIYGARKLDLVIGKKNAPVLKVTGRMASLFKADGVDIDGIDLAAEAREFPLHPLSGLLGGRLPDMGVLNGRFQITGNPAQLAMVKADLATMSPQGLRIGATGGVRHIRMKHENPLAGVEFLLIATAPGWSALPVVAGFGLPDLGPLLVTAAINDHRGHLDVESFEIRDSTPGQGLLRLQGQIRGIGTSESTTLEATLEAASIPWVTRYLQRPEARNEPLTGSIRAATDAEGIRIDDIRFASADGESLSINARGRVLHLSESPAIDLMLEANLSDPPVIASMTGVSLPPFSPVTLTGRVDGNGNKFGYSGKALFGDTAFQSTVSVSFAGLRPLITARLASENVRLEHIGLLPESPPGPSVVPPATRPPAEGPLFDDTPFPLDFLKKIDLFFSLEAGILVGRDTRIENLDLGVRIENGRLRVFPARMVYPAGLAEFDLSIDASGPTPAFDLKLSGEDVDIEGLLATAREPIILSGDLSLVANLSSVGCSRRELASNLMGDISLAIENGRIRRIVNFLSTDAMNLVFATAELRQHVDLNCLVSKLEFQDGLGNIDIFFMDTPRVRANAAGSVNLASERIDMVIHPEQRRRLFRRQASAVRIFGPLNRPAVSTLPLLEAAELFGTILMPYIFLPERALGNLWYLIRRDGRQSPCLQEMRSP